MAVSGVNLEPYGTSTLKGVPDEWQLYIASSKPANGGTAARDGV